MKAVILAGGSRSTINNDSEGIPKPMVEIGEKPVLWHIMKMLSSYHVREFIICGGYKVNLLKDYFRDFYIYQSDITVDLQNNQVICHKNRTEDWQVTVVDTGIDSSLGQRLLQVKEYVGNEDFLVVHGDCLSNIDITHLIKHHKENGKVLTLSVAKPTGRNAALPIDENGLYMEAGEALLPQNQMWADACCRIFKPKVYSYLEKEDDIGDPLFRTLSRENHMVSYFHDGFWCPVETIRDKVYLEQLWQRKQAPWKNWE